MTDKMSNDDAAERRANFDISRNALAPLENILRKLCDDYEKSPDVRLARFLNPTLKDRFSIENRFSTKEKHQSPKIIYQLTKTGVEDDEQKKQLVVRAASHNSTFSLTVDRFVPGGDIDDPTITSYWEKEMRRGQLTSEQLQEAFKEQLDKHQEQQESETKYRKRRMSIGAIIATSLTAFFASVITPEPQKEVEQDSLDANNDTTIIMEDEQTLPSIDH